MTQLAKAAKRRRIALVGDEPELGALATHLIGANREMPFRKGGVSCVDDVERLTSKSAGILI